MENDTTRIDTPERADVDRSVEAVIASGVLGKSARRAALLRYLVERELSGQGRDLKAYSIAVDVLGRDASFDASTDSIVRSEIGRLRDALRLYFAQSPPSGQIRIDIPKGTYRPEFLAPLADGQDGAATTDAKRPAPRMLALLVIGALVVIYAVFKAGETPRTEGPTSVADIPYEVVRIFVKPFEATGDNPDVGSLAFGLQSELIMDLSAYPWISVVASTSGPNPDKPATADYVLSGDVFWQDNSLLTQVRLIDLPDEVVIWNNNRTLDMTPDAASAVLLDISGQIGSRLGSTHGIAPHLAEAQTARTSSAGLDAFLCYLGLHSYLASPTDEDHLGLRDCLLDTVAAFPTFGDAWAALAIIYMDEDRFERNPRPGNPAWKDAGRAVEQALKFAPARMPTLNAALIHSIEAPTRNLEDFEKFAALLIDLFPRHPPTQYNVGSRLAEFAGQWDEGLSLVARAIELEPDPPSAFFLTNAYRAVISGSDSQALSSTRMLTTPTSKSELLLNYLAMSRNDRPAEMEKFRDLLSREGLEKDEDIISHVRGRRYARDLEAALLEQLEQAFLIEKARDP